MQGGSSHELQKLTGPVPTPDNAAEPIYEEVHSVHPRRRDSIDEPIYESIDPISEPVHQRGYYSTVGSDYAEVGDVGTQGWSRRIFR